MVAAEAVKADQLAVAVVRLSGFGRPDGEAGIPSLIWFEVADGADPVAGDNAGGLTLARRGHHVRLAFELHLDAGDVVRAEAGFDGAEKRQ
jgi:hypothetical protein